jgi:hypothetical protein
MVIFFVIEIKKIEIENKLFANGPNSLHIYIKILVIINF